jgi:hypothetical protein
MADGIAAQIKPVRSMSRQQLLELWTKLYRKAPPLKIRRELMVPFLAYRIQENAYGGLKPSTHSELRRITKDLEKLPRSQKLQTRARIRPGTRLVRVWRGESYEVLKTESGYEYHGISFKSLSKIASQITGTQWSGPSFFGLNGSQPAKKGIDD